MSYRQSFLKPKGWVLFNKTHLVPERTHKLSFLRSDKNLFSVLVIYQALEYEGHGL